MAHTISPSPQQMASIARQVGSQFGENANSLVAAAPGAAPVQEITETFPIWIVDDQIGEAPGAAPNLLLRSSAQNTDTLHHNISMTLNPPPGAAAAVPTSEVVGAARSRAQGSGGAYKVEAISVAPPGTDIYRWIRNAAYWVDQNAPGDPDVKLLVIPSRYMHCFWLSYPNKDCVVVIDMPDSFKKLQYQRIYDASEFFSLLQGEPPTRGLGPR